jgi:DNA-directed RNA polymerase specialized sigma24 family protein
VWEHAHEALVFYFSRRHGFHNAEDLAQETLAAILTREDFEFEKDEDFLKICYGFASRISLTAYRRARKQAADPLDPESGGSSAKGLRLGASEARVMLDEVIRTAKSHLNPGDWSLIQQAAADRLTAVEHLSAGTPNNARVRLHRARRKLARLTGWSKDSHPDK